MSFSASLTAHKTVSFSWLLPHAHQVLFGPNLMLSILYPVMVSSVSLSLSEPLCRSDWLCGSLGIVNCALDLSAAGDPRFLDLGPWCIKSSRALSISHHLLATAVL